MLPTMVIKILFNYINFELPLKLTCQITHLFVKVEVAELNWEQVCLYASENQVLTFHSQDKETLD